MTKKAVNMSHCHVSCKFIQNYTISQKIHKYMNSVNFAKKCLTNENTKSIFKKNTKVHRMNLRKTPKFKVKYARTVRMKKSAIISMTNQLNKHHEQKEEILRRS